LLTIVLIAVLDSSSGCSLAVDLDVCDSDGCQCNRNKTWPNTGCHDLL